MVQQAGRLAIAIVLNTFKIILPVGLSFQDSIGTGAIILNFQITLFGKFCRISPFMLSPITADDKGPIRLLSVV